jgi:hypothetical protein
MDLSSFITHVVRHKTLFEDTACVMQFVHDDQIILDDMRSLLVPRLLSILTHDIQSVDLSKDPADAFVTLQSALSTSFLGISQTYYVRGIADLDKKIKQQIMSYLAAYYGPHRVFFFSVDRLTPSTHNVVIDIPDLFSLAQYKTFAQCMLGTSSVAQPLQGLFERSRSGLSTKAVIQSIRYEQIARGPFELDQWELSYLIEPQTSLFTLSQYCFARDSTAFFRLWKTMQHQYNEIFWITYWSEQMWRAYWFSWYVSRNEHAAAKKIGYRLPFSFMQKDYKYVSREDIAAAHQALYELDYRMKHGARLVQCEHLLSEFMVGSHSHSKNVLAK